jgi:hypothetical protein
MKFSVAFLLTLPLLAAAETPEYILEIQHHLFNPDILQVPANTKIRLRIINRDKTPEEFESYSLNREKVISGQSETVIFIGPLDAGEYDFFGEFNPTTAIGKIIAE